MNLWRTRLQTIGFTSLMANPVFKTLVQIAQKSWLDSNKGGHIYCMPKLLNGYHRSNTRPSSSWLGRVNSNSAKLVGTRPVGHHHVRSGQTKPGLPLCPEFPLLLHLHEKRVVTLFLFHLHTREKESHRDKKDSTLTSQALGKRISLSCYSILPSMDSFMAFYQIEASSII